jgi:hypothetical protein
VALERERVGVCGGEVGGISYSARNAHAPYRHP